MVTIEISDTVRGCPEADHGITNDEGRIFDFGEPAAAGVYRMMFAVAFEVRDPDERCGLRVVLSAFGSAVYRV